MLHPPPLPLGSGPPGTLKHEEQFVPGLHYTRHIPLTQSLFQASCSCAQVPACPWAFFLLPALVVAVTSSFSSHKRDAVAFIFYHQIGSLPLW